MKERSEIVATYLVQTSEPGKALTAICRGQSVGNPDLLTSQETKAFLEKWAARGVYHRRSEDTYLMVIRFPQRNFGAEGVNYLLSVLLGGQCDIDLIQGCRLMEVDLGHHTRYWPAPRYGVAGIRQLLHVQGRPLLCGIIKPKIGLSPNQLFEVVEHMVDGGCDVIKEDEILADQYWCSRDQRLRLLGPLLVDRPVLYLTCVTGDGSEVWKEARRAASKHFHIGVHCNLWAGFGTYLDLSRHVQCPIFFQKSGDKVWTTGPFAMQPTVLYQLVHLIGCDFAHVGMYGGYLSETVEALKQRMMMLKTTMPSFSCGMTPALGETIINTFGIDLMLTSGGWIHGQPDGITEAVKTFKRRIVAASEAVRV